MEMAKILDGPLRNLHRKVIRQRSLEVVKRLSPRTWDMKSRVSSSRIDVAKELMAYGEEEAAKRVLTLGDEG
jgi:hypothetical protein